MEMSCNETDANAGKTALIRITIQIVEQLSKTLFRLGSGDRKNRLEQDRQKIRVEDKTESKPENQRQSTAWYSQKQLQLHIYFTLNNTT